MSLVGVCGWGFFVVFFSPPPPPQHANPEATALVSGTKSNFKLAASGAATHPVLLGKRRMLCSPPGVPAPSIPPLDGARGERVSPPEHPDAQHRGGTMWPCPPRSVSQGLMALGGTSVPKEEEGLSMSHLTQGSEGWHEPNEGKQKVGLPRREKQSKRRKLPLYYFFFSLTVFVFFSPTLSRKPREGKAGWKDAPCRLQPASPAGPSPDAALLSPTLFPLFSLISLAARRGMGPAPAPRGPAAPVPGLPTTRPTSRDHLPSHGAVQIH